MADDVLFCSYDLDDAIRQKIASIPNEIDGIPQDQFQISSDDDLTAHFTTRLLIDPLELHENAAEMTQRETQVDVSGDRNRFFSRGSSGPFFIPGTRITVTMPYTGDSGLWTAKTNPYSSMLPRGSIDKAGNSGMLRFVFDLPHDSDPSVLKQRLDGELKLVREYLNWSKAQVESYNAGLSSHVRAAIAQRRERLKKHAGIADLLSIPLKSNPSAPTLNPLTLERRVPPPLPVPPKSGLKPEPGISEGEYERILKILRHEGRSFETTPATFAGLGEEGLRDVILAHLNGHYEGSASGETFRRNGKTDIIIQVENRSAFVAECKLWSGQKAVGDALDQLLSYLTWRDSKAALIFFNTSVAAFSSLGIKLKSSLMEHPLFIKELDCIEAGEWRFRMRSKEDEGRIVTVHCFLFNLYVS